MFPSVGWMMYTRLGVFLVGSSAAICTDREVEKQFWVHQLESLISLQLVDHPANAMTEGWLAPEASPVAKKSTMWYSTTPPEIHKLHNANDLYCTQLNATI
ncbi:hypothetical protein DSO57_1024932 [Entomophthora muscae]|uniref:Uncharacterized protein n=1 Tax=Entomophthora muscae TaxID=34485 RepID=A0ACC2UBY2_9FUNG|nr:hypothetical protein DSO57_1024932 [Entomophthora muscae]